MPGWVKWAVASAVGVIIALAVTAVWNDLAFVRAEAEEHETMTQPKMAQMAATVTCLNCKVICLEGCRRLTAGDPNAICDDHCASTCRVECGR